MLPNSLWFGSIFLLTFADVGRARSALTTLEIFADVGRARSALTTLEICANVGRARSALTTLEIDQSLILTFPMM